MDTKQPFNRVLLMDCIGPVFADLSLARDMIFNAHRKGELADEAKVAVAEIQGMMDKYEDWKERGFESQIEISADLRLGTDTVSVHVEHYRSGEAVQFWQYTVNHTRTVYTRHSGGRTVDYSIIIDMTDIDNPVIQLNVKMDRNDYGKR